MKVAVLAHSFPRFPGDTHGPFVQDLSEALARRGHQVWALVPFDPQLQEERDSPLTIRGFRYVWPDRLHLLGYSRTLSRDIGMKLWAYLESPLYFLAARRALERLVRREGIEMIHAHWILPNGYVASQVSRATGVPYAATLHGSDVFMAERNPLFSALARKALAGAAHVTSCSGELRTRLLRLGGEEHADKVLLVPNGTRPLGEPAVTGAPAGSATAPTPPAAPTPSAPPAAPGFLASLGLDLPPDARPIVAVGRLVDKKGFVHLVDAAPRILERVPEARIVIGGGGPLESLLRRRARELGVEERVLFTGGLSHDQVLGLLAAAEVVVMPSVRDPRGNVDGLPIVVLEAMAAGRPVVATDVSGIPMAIEHERTGLLIPERDDGAVAGAVLDLLAAPERARALGEAARQRVETELNWDAVAETHDRLYRKAVGDRGEEDR